MTKASLLNSKVGAVLAMGVVGGVGVWYVKKQAAEALTSVGDAVNPLSQDNIFNQGVNRVVEVLTGDENQTLGSWLYDLFNGTPQEQVQRRAEKAYINKIGG
jgi:hypothetical protein